MPAVLSFFGAKNRKPQTHQCERPSMRQEKGGVIVSPAMTSLATHAFCLKRQFIHKRQFIQERQFIHKWKVGTRDEQTWIACKPQTD